MFVVVVVVVGWKEGAVLSVVSMSGFADERWKIGILRVACTIFAAAR